MKVAILGAGPAGLMAAYACERNGLEPVIYALDRQPSQVNYDMFLQRPLPGQDERAPDDEVEYIRMGSRGGYAKKCYGSWSAPVSWKNIQWGPGDIWWLRDTYELLWERYEGSVISCVIGAEQAAQIAADFNFTFSTVPAPGLCANPEHTFSAIPTWLVRDGRSYDPRERNELVYNGAETPKWFRYSRLRGVRTWEYAQDPQIAFPEEISDEPVVLMGKKFTGNTCDCHPAINRVGRWAQWQRGVLNHHAFEQTTAILASAGLGKVA